MSDVIAASTLLRSALRLDLGARTPPLTVEIQSLVPAPQRASGVPALAVVEGRRVPAGDLTAGERAVGVVELPALRRRGAGKRRQQPQQKAEEQNSLEAVPGPERARLPRLAANLSEPGANQFDLGRGQLSDQIVGGWRRRRGRADRRGLRAGRDPDLVPAPSDQ